MTTDKKLNGNSKGDDLAIPAFLEAKNRKPADKAPPKPTPAKPAPKAAVKKAPKAKPLSAKQLAQQAAGVKVTEAKAPEAPKAAAPAAPAPKAPAAPAKPTLARTAPKAGELLKAVKKHGAHFAHKNGWDLLIAQSDSEIAQAFEGATSKAAAIAAARKAAQALDKKRPKDKPAPERNR